MPLRVKVIAPFEISGQAPDGTVELAEGSRLKDLLKMAVRAPIYTALLPISVNGVQARRSQVLRDGDVVILIMPVSGGSGILAQGGGGTVSTLEARHNRRC